MIRAAVCNSIGKIELQHIPSPSLMLKDQVKLKVFTCGVNFADKLQIEGKYQIQPKYPFVPGFEAFGQVQESNSKEFHVGDYVLAAPQFGAFAQEIVVPGNRVFKINELKGSLSEDQKCQAAALLVTYGTAQLAINRAGGIRQKDNVLITAAVGGVGSAAIQLAKLKAPMANVIAMVGGEEKVKQAQNLGATIALNYEELKSTDNTFDSKLVKDALMKATNNQGLNVVIDMVGTDNLFNGIVRSMAFEGKLCVVGFAGGSIPTIKANLLLVKNFSVIGVFWGQYFDQIGFGKLQKDTDEVIEFWRRKQLIPKIASVHTLENVQEALIAVSNRSAIGKVILKME